MNTSPELLNLFLSGLMGIFGGLITIPINAYFMRALKRDELILEHRLDAVNQKRDLLLQHELERLKATEAKDEVATLRAAIGRVEEALKYAK